MKRPPVSEAVVLKACLDYLTKVRRVRAWRQNSGTAQYAAHAVPAYGGEVIRPRRVAFGLRGAADITGILPDGRRLEVECKRPGGRQEPHQKKFQAMIEENNGVYILARSADELREKLDEHII